MTLKVQLEQLRDKEWNGLSRDSLDSLLADMLEQIGDVDPELRDGLIYPTFMKILDDGLLTDMQYRLILSRWDKLVWRI